MHQIHTKHAQISEKVLHTPSNETLASLKKIHTSKKKANRSSPYNPRSTKRSNKLETKSQDPSEEVVGESGWSRTAVVGWSGMAAVRLVGGHVWWLSGRRWSGTTVVGETVVADGGHRGDVVANSGHRGDRGLGRWPWRGVAAAGTDLG
jgi:hypothetical protein